MPERILNLHPVKMLSGCLSLYCVAICVSCDRCNTMTADGVFSGRSPVWATFSKLIGSGDTWSWNVLIKLNVLLNFFLFVLCLALFLSISVFFISTVFSLSAADLLDWTGGWRAGLCVLPEGKWSLFILYNFLTIYCCECCSTLNILNVKRCWTFFADVSDK